MNLYLLSQKENVDYDTYDAAVMAAETAEQAQAMHPNGRADPWREGVLHTWTAPENVIVQLIGTATPGTKAGVVLASFNAG